MEENKLNYNFVIFGTPADYMVASYYDINQLKGAKYIQRLDNKSILLNFLFDIFTKPALNKLFKLPFRKVFNRFSFKNSFENNKPICFIFFGNDQRRTRNGLIKYLKRKYVDCKLIAFCQDLVETYRYFNKDDYDLILSFDKGDCQKYGFLYYPLVYSKMDIHNKGNSFFESDVFFVGKAKNRYKRIIDAYNLLSNKGLKCLFFITDVKKKDQIKGEGLHYCKKMKYSDNLLHISMTHNLLDINQLNGTGYTLRFCEATVYQKRLITDNTNITDSPYYKKENIVLLNDIKEINVDILKSQCPSCNYDNGLSPIKLLGFIGDCLNNIENHE